MTYRRSILRGYDKAIEPLIAQALHIPLNRHSKLKGGRKMKIPMSMLKGAGNKEEKDTKKKGGKGKLSMLKKKNDKDGDE